MEVSVKMVRTVKAHQCTDRAVGSLAVTNVHSSCHHESLRESVIILSTNDDQARAPVRFFFLGKIYIPQDFTQHVLQTSTFLVALLHWALFCMSIAFLSCLC